MNNIQFTFIESSTGQYVVIDKDIIRYCENNKTAVSIDRKTAAKKVSMTDDVMISRVNIVKTPIQKTIYKKILYTRGKYKTNLKMFIIGCPPESSDPTMNLEELPLIENANEILTEMLNC